MQDLNKEINNLLNNIENNLKGIEKEEIIKKDIFNIVNLLYGEINNIKDSYDQKLENILLRESLISEKMLKIEKTISEIEKDIYEEDVAEMDIICPYCNYEFSIDIFSETEKEVKCPECNNSIELFFDPDGEDSCSGNCNHCGLDCEHDDEDN